MDKKDSTPQLPPISTEDSLKTHLQRFKLYVTQKGTLRRHWPIHLHTLLTRKYLKAHRMIQVVEGVKYEDIPHTLRSQFGL